MDYYLVETEGLNGEPGTGGGLGKRGETDQRIMNYTGVPSVDEYLEKVEKPGGRANAKNSCLWLGGILQYAWILKTILFGSGRMKRNQADFVYEEFPILLIQSNFEK